MPTDPVTGLSAEEAVAALRDDPSFESLIRDSYLDIDVFAAAKRFHSSGEFKEALRIARSFSPEGPLLDLGAGRGIAAFAFASEGFEVVAAEPDESSDIGAGAAARLLHGLHANAVRATAEGLPFHDSSFGIVYLRQVLHHLPQLAASLREISRVLKPGGVLFASREHVVDDEQQLATFLKRHPIHQLAGCEGAFPLPHYTGAIEQAGLEIESVLGPWDSVINAFPEVRDTDELADYPAHYLRRHAGQIGLMAARRPWVRRAVWSRLNRPLPGRLFTFVARRTV